MAILTVQQMSTAGRDPASYLAAASAGGDQFDNNGREFFHVKNSSAGSITVTIDSVPDVSVSVPASGERLIGPFDPKRFNDSSGRVRVSYSSATSVTVAAVRL